MHTLTLNQSSFPLWSSILNRSKKWAVNQPIAKLNWSGQCGCNLLSSEVHLEGCMCFLPIWVPDSLPLVLWFMVQLAMVIAIQDEIEYYFKTVPYLCSEEWMAYCGMVLNFDLQVFIGLVPIDSVHPQSSKMQGNMLTHVQKTDATFLFVIWTDLLKSQWLIIAISRPSCHKTLLITTIHCLLEKWLYPTIGLWESSMSRGH